MSKEPDLSPSCRMAARSSQPMDRSSLWQQLLKRMHPGTSDRGQLLVMM